MNLEKIEIGNYHEVADEAQRIDKIKQICSPRTSLDKCIEIAQGLFPYEKKMEMREGADHDRRGRPVSYFRLMSYAELESLFLRGKIDPLDHPRAREVFESRREEIKNTINNIFNDLPDDIKKEISFDFNKLIK